MIGLLGSYSPQEGGEGGIVLSQAYDWLIKVSVWAWTAELSNEAYQGLTERSRPPTHLASFSFMPFLVYIVGRRRILSLHVL